MIKVRNQQYGHRQQMVVCGRGERLIHSHVPDNVFFFLSCCFSASIQSFLIKTNERYCPHAENPLSKWPIFNFQMILLILFIALHSIQIKRIDLFSI